MFLPRCRLDFSKLTRLLSLFLPVLFLFIHFYVFFFYLDIHPAPPERDVHQADADHRVGQRRAAAEEVRKKKMVFFFFFFFGFTTFWKENISHFHPTLHLRGQGRDYYTFAFDDPEEFFEEDSLPG